MVVGVWRNWSAQIPYKNKVVGSSPTMPTSSQIRTIDALVFVGDSLVSDSVYHVKSVNGTIASIRYGLLMGENLTNGKSGLLPSW